MIYINTVDMLYLRFAVSCKLFKHVQNTAGTYTINESWLVSMITFSFPIIFELRVTCAVLYTQVLNTQITCIFNEEKTFFYHRQTVFPEFAFPWEF